MKSFGVFVVLLIGLMGLQGCATAPLHNDYFGHATELNPDPEDVSLLWWEKPGFNWHKYSKIMLDPVNIQINENKVKHNFDPEELEGLRRDITDAFIENLKPEYQVVNTPGTDVLRIRAAIINIDPSSPTLNLVTTLALFMPLDLGGATIAVEFLDSTNGERLAAMVDCKSGTPFQLMDGFKKFGHARAAFEQWAQALKLALVNNP